MNGDVSLDRGGEEDHRVGLSEAHMSLAAWTGGSLQTKTPR